MERTVIREVSMAIMGILMVAGTLYLTYTSQLPTEVLSGVIGSVITFYFKERETNAVRRSYEREQERMRSVGM